MQNRKTVLEEIEMVSTLKMISQAYEEISVMRMQKIRDSILKTRSFIEQLAGVFYDVRQSHNRFIKFAEENRLDNISPYSLLPRNGKKIAVLFSANEKMNGEILSKVFHVFHDWVKENSDADIAIIGRIGKEMYSQRGLTKEYQFFHVGDDVVKVEESAAIMKHLVNYQEINVFYGKFQNIVNQDAIVANISGDKPFDGATFGSKPTDGSVEIQNEGKGQIKERRFLYEPSIEEITEFFETQIFSGLFKHAIDESHLSRYASRIKAMEEALVNINAKSKKLQSEERKIKKSVQNRKQNAAIAGMALWTK